MAVMMSPRERWTDERLDDLSSKVDRGFLDVKAEMRGRFNQLETRMDVQFAQVNDRFDRMQQTLIAGFVVIVAALLGVIATLAGIALL
ncbi:MAG TPA: hypothetical protein VEP91_00315 [Solirubrobacterales bacterium]|nr:hypothetical protein [Solirubrobacterales bacterium]